MSEPKQEALARYVERVMALKEERDALLSDDELRDVALEIGLGEADLAAAEEAAEDHYVRGLGFLDHGRFDDAVGELREAVAVAPRRVEWLHALARAHAGRWRERRGEADRSRAENLARECLEIDPTHSASIAVLDDLDRPPRTPEPAAGRRPRKALVPALVGTALLFAVVLFNLQRASVDDPAPPQAPASGPPAPAATGSAASETRELDVPVDLDPGETGLDVELDVRHSRLKSYPGGKSFYTLYAILANRGVTELDKMAVRLELLDGAGTVVQTDEFDALSRASPVLRPGDAEALHRLRETLDTVRRARFAVVTVDQNPAADAYAPGKEIVFDWRTPPPAGLEIALRERSYTFSETAFAKNGSGFFDLVVEVENTGERTLRGLKLSAEIIGPEERWTVAEEKHVVTSGGPAMRPGEVRLERFIEKVEARPEGYRIFVEAR